jgi:hypothetical protein
MENIDPITDHLQGQLLATQVVLRALLRTSPPLRAAAVFELERFHAAGLYTRSSEALLLGMQHAEHALLPDEPLPAMPPGA